MSRLTGTPRFNAISYRAQTNQIVTGVAVATAEPRGGGGVMDNNQAPHKPSLADYRQQLVQTLDKILEREQQWFTALESHAEEVGKPLIDYMSDHISILTDTVVALASSKYRSLLVSDEVTEAICKDIASYIDFAMASHFRTCTNINSILVAKGVTTVNLQPMVL